MRSDEPGFTSPMPGTPPVTHQSAMTAPGSEGATVSASGGDLGTPVVSVLGQSSQVPPDVGRVDAADTFSGSSDDPMSSGAISGGSVQASASWAADSSHVSTPPHPNARK